MFQEQTRQIPANEPSRYQETKEGLVTDSSEKSHTYRDLTWLWSGIVGAAVVVVILILLAIINPRFRVSGYYVNEDPSLLTEMLSSQMSSKDSIFVSKAMLLSFCYLSAVKGGRINSTCRNILFIARPLPHGSFVYVTLY